MNVKSVVENKEKFQVELTIEVGQEEFEAGLDQAYRKSRGNISVPGFRKGKAPRKVIEGMYGAGVFYEDAVEEIYPQACQDAIVEKGLDFVAPPQVEILSLGKEGFTFKATVTVRPVVTLKQYKGLEADKVLPTVTETSVENELKQFVDRATQLEPVDRAAEMGDSMVMDYEGRKDGVPFDGGAAKGYELALGSHTFIPGFEEGVVGMKAGDEKTIDLTFPENYHAEDLAGKPVQFTVKCIEVKEKKVPTIDDEFAKDVSEFDTLDELKADLKKQLSEKKAEDARRDLENQLLEQAIDGMEAEIPEVMFTKRADEMINDYAYRLQAQGIDLQTYLQYMGQDMDAFRATFKDGAEKQVKASLVLEAIVAAEKLEATEDEINAEIDKLAQQYGMEAEQIKKAVPADQIAADVTTKKALDLIVDSAKLVAKKAEKKAAKKSTAKKADDKKAEKKPAAKKTAAKKPAAKKTAKKEEDAE